MLIPGTPVEPAPVTECVLVQFDVELADRGSRIARQAVESSASVLPFRSIPMSLAAFAIAATALAFTPGPGIAYVVARTVSGGRAEGVASCFGTALGGMLHVAAAALGLSLLLAQSATAFAVVKYVGAAYLVYLGIRLVLRKDGALLIETVAAQGARRAFAEGIVVEALNVKTALFFLAFLPQFTSPDSPVAPQLVVLGSVCVMLNTLADVVAVMAAHRLLRSEAARAARARLLTRASGITMVGLGAWLALARRDA
jgi:threonine/homoserine/homoserine lactone efflux protein